MVPSIAVQPCDDFFVPVAAQRLTIKFRYCFHIEFSADRVKVELVLQYHCATWVTVSLSLSLLACNAGPG